MQVCYNVKLHPENVNYTCAGKTLRSVHESDLAIVAFHLKYGVNAVPLILTDRRKSDVGLLNEEK